MFVYFVFVFFFNDTATTEIYTLSLHDALPIYVEVKLPAPSPKRKFVGVEEPVPPPATLSVPEREGVYVSVSPEPTIVRAEVRPLVVLVDDAIVMVAPVCVCPVGPMPVMPAPALDIAHSPLGKRKQPDVSEIPFVNVEVALPVTAK